MHRKPDTRLLIITEEHTLDTLPRCFAAQLVGIVADAVICGVSYTSTASRNITTAELCGL